MATCQLRNEESIAKYKESQGSTFDELPRALRKLDDTKEIMKWGTFENAGCARDHRVIPTRNGIDRLFVLPKSCRELNESPMRSACSNGTVDRILGRLGLRPQLAGNPDKETLTTQGRS